MTSTFPRKSYWFCQAIGWGLWVGTNAAIYASVAPKTDLAKALALVLYLGFVGIAGSHTLRWFALRGSWMELSLPALTFRVLIASFLAGCVTAVFHLVPAIYFLNTSKTSDLKPVHYPIVLIQWVVLYVVWLAIYAVVHTVTRSRAEVVRRLKAEVAASEAELRALKTQINPHFLFNCLNSIRALITENPEAAQDAVTRLSGILRYSLQSDRRTLVPLREEMETVADYLRLEHIRFESRLQANSGVSEEAGGVEIPPMIVQTLVENAIKHGISKLPAGGAVRVNADLESEGLRIHVLSPGRLEKPDSNGIGLGLENARKRLRLLCGDAAYLKLTDDAGVVTAEVWIPRCAH